MKVWYVKTVSEEFYSECNIKSKKLAKKEIMKRHGLESKDVIKFEEAKGLE